MPNLQVLKKPASFFFQHNQKAPYLSWYFLCCWWGVSKKWNAHSSDPSPSLTPWIFLVFPMITVRYHMTKTLTKISKKSLHSVKPSAWDGLLFW
jgi:hypothetical protein